MSPPGWPVQSMPLAAAEAAALTCRKSHDRSARMRHRQLRYGMSKPVSLSASS
jgi:hypothetical protein